MEPTSVFGAAWSVFCKVKDVLPILGMLYWAIFGLGTKSTSIDMIAKNQQEDHAAIITIREDVSKLTAATAASSADLKARLEILLLLRDRNAK